MTQKKKHHASYSQRNDFWQDVDMDEYYNNLEYREKIEKAWDNHRYLWDERTKETLWDNNEQPNTQRTNRRR